MYNAFHIALIAVLLTGFCVILFNVKEPEQQEEKPETTQAEVIQNPETMTQMTESIEDKYKVFDTMSEDWGSGMNPDMSSTRPETTGTQRDICRYMRNGTPTGCRN